MEVIVALLAAFIALLAWKSQRTHNRLSVTPFPSLGLSSYNDRLGIVLANNGIGPMRVLKLRFVKNDGTSFESAQSVVSTRNADFITSADGTALAPNKRIAVLKVKGIPEERGTDMHLTRVELSEFKIVVEYTDVYGTSFPPYSKDLKWFTEHG
ncbi:MULTISPECIES: hypothetical protein [unclassified Stenotrophomonas]|uniref:hypothetical protein n=1 Tax=unclassified Stenotrophomonas TaxID=196198 RepID=UPI00346699CB